MQSSISADLWYARLPRGCALSWTSLYMAQFAPDEAAELYSRYREHYGRTVLGCGGFREWPAGSPHGGDADSGPIVLEVGVAATGLGLGAARLFRDAPSFSAVERSAAVFGLPTWSSGGRHYRLSPLLGEAILFHGETARPWFGQPLRASGGRQVPFPTGPALVALIWCAAVAALARRTWRLWREARAFAKP